MEYYSLGERITAFTTDRSIGRDRSLLLAALHVSCKDMVYPHQTHTDRVAVVDEELLSLPAAQRKENLEGVDAVISRVRNVVVGISTADCIPVIVYDAEHDAAAAIHAGWKGTRLRIVEKAVARMQQVFGTNAASCTAAIGPGISQDSFEVGQEVVDAFSHAGFEMERYTIMKRRPHIDLKEINRQQLMTMGLQEQNIQVSDIDTFTDGRFFSARREQLPPAADGTVVKCGRILSGFVLH